MPKRSDVELYVEEVDWDLGDLSDRDVEIVFGSYGFQAWKRVRALEDLIDAIKKNLPWPLSSLFSFVFKNQDL